MKPQIALGLSLLSIGLAFTAGSSLAQDTANPPPPPAGAAPADGTQPPPPPGRGRRGGFVLEELTQKLGLTPDQQKQVGDIIKAGREQMKALRDDDSVPEDDKRAKGREIMNSTRSQIRAALTPDQQKIFDAMPVRGPRPQNPPPGGAPGDNPPAANPPAAGAPPSN